MVTIKKASQLTGLSEDTLRYYEKIGLLPRVQRMDNGRRTYSQEDLYKLQLINCLKKTGMPLEEMKPYLDMPRNATKEELPELYDMMKSHRERVQKQMQDLQTVLDYIDAKLEEDSQPDRNCTEETSREPAASPKERFNSINLYQKIPS
ncbi:MerR family transcriptional regulator [Paenibacillus enshidis]|uniref:MerR family transcriptional regulator n=1 Tax=Paenibacillus enshidis TaxID=1458439 RepID=A0ABV5AVL8_9BACL